MGTSIRKALDSDVAVLIDLSRRTIGATYPAFLGETAVDAFLGSGRRIDTSARTSIAASSSCGARRSSGTRFIATT
jgi:hypothetical protein